MPSINKIALCVPDVNSSNNSLTLRLKQRIYNEPCEFLMPKKLLALSDIEGNFIEFTRLLIGNNVIDKYFRWTFEDGHLVIVGDCFDRGEYVLECLWLIYGLEEKAKRKGGYVHFILGNHEIMNMNGDWRYVHPKYAKKAASSKRPASALYYGNNEIWRWLHSKNIIEKIGDILFVHGGFSKQVIDLKLDINKINSQARLYYTSLENQIKDSMLNEIFHGTHSPFWYRGYYEGTATQEQIDFTLDTYNVKTIVTGHSLVEHVSTYFDQKVINIDTNHAAGKSEALLIEGNSFYKVDQFGVKERLK